MSSRRAWQAGRRRASRLALTTAAALALAAPAVSAQPAPGASALDAVQRDLGRAQADAAAIDAQVRAARQELAGSEDRLAASTGRLSVLLAELDRAEAAAAAAQARSADVDAELRLARGRLDAIRAELATWERRLAETTRDAYRHGAATRLELASALMDAGSPGEFIDAMAFLSSAVDHDRERVDDAATAAREADRAQDQVERLRQRRIAEERLAEQLRAGAEALAREQREVVERVDAERRRREQIVERLSNNQALADALARQLQRQSRRLAERLRADQARALAAAAQGPVDFSSLGPPPAWADRLPPNGQRWAPAIVVAGEHAGVDPRLLTALVWTESAFQPRASSSAGAIGLTQLMPATARSLGVDPWKPLENLDGGSRYLAAQLARFGSVDLALAAYNAGPGAVERHGGVPPYAETQAYVLRVLSLYEQLAA